MLRFLALGPPGVGKADLGKTLSEATGRTHLSVGHLLREEAKKETERAQLINDAILLGALVATVGINSYEYSAQQIVQSTPNNQV